MSVTNAATVDVTSSLSATAYFSIITYYWRTEFK